MSGSFAWVCICILDGGHFSFPNADADPGTIGLALNLQFPPQKKLQGMTNNVGLTFSVGDTIPRFTISIEQDNLTR